jgi:hypothetical protein
MNKKILLATLLLSAGSYNLYAADEEQHPADVAHAELKESIEQIHQEVENKVQDTKAQIEIINTSFAMVERNLKDLEKHLDNSVDHTGELTKVTKQITDSPSAERNEESQGNPKTTADHHEVVQENPEEIEVY